MFKTHKKLFGEGKSPHFILYYFTFAYLFVMICIKTASFAI